MRELSFEEFNNIVKNVNYDDYEGNGSSRLVFNIKFEGHDCVLKLAGCHEGRTQTEFEINTYKNCDNGFREYIATIYAYYKNVAVIMEKVVSYDYCSDTELEEEDNYEYYQYDTEERRKIVSIIDEHIGQSGDNQQLGYSKERNKIVLFDYGFSVDANRSDQVGCLSDYGYEEYEKILKYYKMYDGTYNLYELMKNIELDIRENIEYYDIETYDYENL